MAGRLKRGALKRDAPFAYRAGKTALHRMPAGLKMIFVIIISTIAYGSLYGLAVSVMLILAASAIARIPPPVLLKGSKPLFILSLCVILLKTINGEGYIEGLLTASRLFVPFASACLLFSVTTMRELRLSLAFIHAPFFSLAISLMLGFIPRFFVLWDDANLACDSRSCKRGLRRLFMLVPLVTERMMEASANTALALEARGWGMGSGV
jgi:biotin transport system permease protein